MSEAPKGMVPRLIGWTLDSDLRCPAGHRLKRDAFTFGDVALRCRHRVAGGECGRWLYVFPTAGARPVTLTPNDAPRLVYVAEVTWEEVRQWQADGISLVDICQYLTIWYVPSRVGGAPLANSV